MIFSFTGNLRACDTGLNTPPASVGLAKANARLVLSAPGSGSGADNNVGSMNLKARLSSADTGNSCVNVASSAATDAAMPWLQFNWDVGLLGTRTPPGVPASGWTTRQPTSTTSDRTTDP